MVETGSFDVAITETEDGWVVRVSETGGTVVLERGCRDGSEARTFASTVRQHAYWLSPERFLEYYRIQEGWGLGFNAMQPGKVKKADRLMLGVALILIVAAIVWVVR